MQNARISLLWYLIARGKQQEKVNSKSSLPELALLLSARSRVSPAAFLTPEKWRKMRNAPLTLLWHLVACSKQQEKYSLARSKLGLPKLALLLSAWSPVGPVASPRSVTQWRTYVKGCPWKHLGKEPVVLFPGSFLMTVVADTHQAKRLVNNAR